MSFKELANLHLYHLNLIWFMVREEICRGGSKYFVLFNNIGRLQENMLSVDVETMMGAQHQRRCIAGVCHLFLFFLRAWVWAGLPSMDIDRGTAGIDRSSNEV